LYHPDKVTDEAEKKKVEAKFKVVKEAWEAIENGYTVERAKPPGAAPKSSFTQGPSKPQQPYAGKPAPGYEARRTAPVLPHTYTKSAGGRYGSSREYAVKLEITEDQAFEGCTVPFWHDGTVRDYVVRPGTASRIERVQYPLDAMIGRSVGTITIEIELVVLAKRSEPEERTRDAEMDLSLCALGLFTGGKVSVLDHLGEKVSITIPAGYNPAEPIKIPDRGFGSLKRGALIVRIIPVFKAPDSLNDNERKQLQRLNEMART
jgi:hypothetical protein